MQFLVNQGKFNFGVYPKSEAYNPFNQVHLSFINSSLKISKSEEVDCSPIAKESQAGRLSSSLPSLFSFKALLLSNSSKPKKSTGKLL